MRIIQFSGRFNPITKFTITIPSHHAFSPNGTHANPTPNPWPTSRLVTIRPLPHGPRPTGRSRPFRPSSVAPIPPNRQSQHRQITVRERGPCRRSACVCSLLFVTVLYVLYRTVRGPHHALSPCCDSAVASLSCPAYSYWDQTPDTIPAPVSPASVRCCSAAHQARQTSLTARSDRMRAVRWH